MTGDVTDPTDIAPTQRGRPPCEVLHISSVHPCDDVRIIYRECVVLRHAGINVEAAFFDVAPDAEVAGVPLVSLGRRPGSRLFRAIKATWSACRIVKQLTPRIVHLHDPELLPLAMYLKHKGVTVFYDAHEDLPRQVFHKPWIPSWARAWVSRTTESLLPRFLSGTDAVIVAASHIRLDWIRERPHVLLRNMPIRSRRIVSSGEGFAQREAAAIYAGLLSPARGLQAAVTAVLQAGGKVYLAGRGDEAYVDSLVMLDPLRVEYVGNLEPAMLDALMARCRVGLALLPPAPAYLEAIPSKVFDYLKAGLPFVWSDFAHWRDALSGDLACHAVDPANHAAVVARLIPLLSDEAAWTEARRRVSACARHYPSAEEESAQLLELYQNTLEVA